MLFLVAGRRQASGVHAGRDEMQLIIQESIFFVPVFLRGDVGVWRLLSHTISSFNGPRGLKNIVSFVPDVSIVTTSRACEHEGRREMMTKRVKIYWTAASSYPNAAETTAQ